MIASRAARRVKRAIDIAGAVIMLLPAAPVMAMVALLIRLTDGAPVLHRQTRPGLRGRPFELIKFRTMRIAPADLVPGLGDAARLTRVGRLLRRTHLDELPQLWIVLRGDMSLVGPRPLLMSYLDRYTPEQRRRHDVPPGVTGLAQVRGGNALNWDERFRLDLWYVDHWSLGLDLRILGLTVVRVLRPWHRSPAHDVSAEFVPVGGLEPGGNGRAQAGAREQI